MLENTRKRQDEKTQRVSIFHLPSWKLCGGVRVKARVSSELPAAAVEEDAGAVAVAVVIVVVVMVVVGSGGSSSRRIAQITSVRAIM